MGRPLVSVPNLDGCGHSSGLVIEEQEPRLNAATPFLKEEVISIYASIWRNATESATAIDLDIAGYCEEGLKSCIAAINTRNFDPNSAPWTSMAEDFRMSFSSSKHRATTKPEHVQIFKDMTAEMARSPDQHPEHVNPGVSGRRIY
ncbi:hypothetical protein DOTSEDRAFT_18964 [Dothistroma septosporum NZE10]|uniref:Uncharacterized protein n=1 Tax=Dothistroma septosporum (strain NZE10 / CBS 128990) TaxID=675120 RepID=N1PY24_DOTSN|nr:hypothetical protein DOTSEDRAFT_18964 [Dothistroma septosporum NZE10]